MSLPTECKMPDLSDLNSHLINRLIILLLVGENNLTTNAALYRRIFVRLIDKAINEYNEARILILAQIDEIKHADDVSNKGRSLYLIYFPDQSCQQPRRPQR